MNWERVATSVFIFGTLWVNKCRKKQHNFAEKIKLEAEDSFGTMKSLIQWKKENEDT